MKKNLADGEERETRHSDPAFMVICLHVVLKRKTLRQIKVKHNMMLDHFLDINNYGTTGV